MEVSVKRNGKEIPLHGGKVLAIFLVLIFSVIVVIYAGNIIGECAQDIIDKIIDNAEQHADDCKECDEKQRIPVDIVNHHYEAREGYREHASSRQETAKEDA